MGENFNPFGYSLVFRSDLNRTDYLTFNMAIYDIKDSLNMILVDNIVQPLDPVGGCTSIAENAGQVVLQVKHIFGILVMTGAFFGLGVIFGIIENFIDFFIRSCPCCPKTDDDDIFDMTEDPETEEDEVEADPSAPSLEVLEPDMTVGESLLELQV